MAKVKDVMTPNPVICHEDDSIYDVVRIMGEENCKFVPILDINDQLAGVVTERDVCLRTIINRKDPEETPVKMIMNKSLVVCQPDDELDDVLDRMEQRRLKRVLVTDGAGCCLGVVGIDDIARFRKDKAAELMGFVSV